VKLILVSGGLASCGVVSGRAIANGPSLISWIQLAYDLSRMTNDELDTDLRLRKQRIHRTGSLIDCYDGEKLKSVALRFYEQINHPSGRV
jgi:hypothetical protein